MKINAAVLRKTGAEISVEELELESPRTAEVLVELKASGICHSDYHVVTGDAGHELPVVLGHEGAGIVKEIGEGVSTLKAGDHVALSWIPFCGNCYLCMHGKTNLCKAYIGPLWEGTMFDGTTRLRDSSGASIRHLSSLACWATHAVVPEQSCVPIPGELPMDVASIIGCAVTTGVGAALNKARVSPGSSVVVYGAGGVGLSVVMGAKLAGAAKIIVVDISDSKKDLAESFGATHFALSDQGTLDEIWAITDGLGADYVFEAVGKTDLESKLVDTIRPGGTAVMIGFPASGEKFQVNPAEIIRDEKVLTGSIYGTAHTKRDFVKYGELCLNGKLPVDRLITSTCSLEQINEACKEMIMGDSGRIIINFN